MITIEGGIQFLEKEISYLLNISIHLELIKNNHQKILLKEFFE